jgi:hypothetical protein
MLEIQPYIGNKYGKCSKRYMQGKQLQEINVGEATTFGLIDTSYDQADLSGQCSL